MKKRIVIWTLALLACVVAGIIWVYLYSIPHDAGQVTESEKAEFLRRLGRISVPVAPATPLPLDLKQSVRLAMGGLGLGNDQQDGRLDDLVLASLTDTPGLDLVERQSLEVVLNELNLGLSGLVRAGDAVRVGKLLKADWFLLGSQAAISGTNLLVIRLVDAHTGIMRDSGVFPADETPVTLAAAIAGFVRQCRQDAATGRPRVYLAIGGFKDESLNSRQAEFPTQLRAYLTSAYHGSGITLLEREAVDVLLQEVRLDLAGLTEEEGTDPPAPMQSAFWLVDGDYQSYESTNFQVEAEVHVERMFGRQVVETFRGPPDERFFAQIKGAIDRKIQQDTMPVAPSRLTEARAELNIGKSLFPNFEPIYVPWYGDFEPGQLPRMRRNLEAAIQAFETVLLLEPTNREAKMYLGYALRTSLINREDEGRDYYRQILDESVQDRWGNWARMGLLDSFQWSDADEKARWFAAAAANTNSPAIAFYREQAEAASKDIVIRQNDSPQALRLAQDRLLASIRECENVIKGHGGTFRSDFGMADFVSDLRNGGADPGRLLADFLPRMEHEFPELRASLIATVISYQSDTNTPLIAEFETSLDNCVEHPERLLDVWQFWSESHTSFCNWCFDKKDYAPAIRFLEAEQAAAQTDPSLFEAPEKIKLAYAYLGARRWQNALDIFNSFNGRPVETMSGGPWGEAFIPVLTDRMAAYCRNKITPGSGGTPAFALDATNLRLCAPSAFAADSSGLWLAIADQLIRLDLDLKTNLVIHLPKPADDPVAAIEVGDAKIWVGTIGAGLIEFDQATRQFKTYTENDGLLMNDISSLHVDGDSLWIGYRGLHGGGLGRLDLRSHQSRTFMGGLPGGVETSGDVDPTPRDGVANIAGREPGRFWVQGGGTVWQFDAANHTWKNASVGSLPGFTCFAADATHLVQGSSISIILYQLKQKSSFPGPRDKTLVFTGDEMKDYLKANPGWYVWGRSGGGLNSYEGGLSIRLRGGGQWLFLTNAAAMPFPPAVLALDGPNLWIGGEGYLSLMNLTKKTIRRLCSIPVYKVERIEIAGGYVWVEYDQCLHRAALSQLQ